MEVGVEGATALLRDSSWEGGKGRRRGEGAIIVPGVVCDSARLIVASSVDSCIGRALSTYC
jgi:hypothetical protein